MRLLRDLWAASPRRTATVGLLILLGAAGGAAAASLAGPVLVHRSVPYFVALTVALGVSVVADLTIGLVMARLTADWSARVRRQLCGVAFGQDLQTLETTPVGELLDRIDNDVYQVGSDLRGPGVRIVQSLGFLVFCVGAAIALWWPAGVGMLLLMLVLFVTLRKPTLAITPARVHEEEAWSDLAAVMEESIHGQDDVRASLARPYVLRLYAQRASQVLARGRRVWRMGSRVTATAGGATRAGIAVVVLGGLWALATGNIDSARLTAIWMLAIGFGGTVEHVSRMVPELQHALGAWARVQLLRSSPQEPTGGAVPVDGDLVLRGLTYRYPAGDGEERPRPALDDVHLEFVRGRSYALIGRTGSGKSTLAKVLTRAVEVPRGTVFLGGTDVLDLDLQGLRRWIAIVPQRTEILAGTLAQNIALFDETLLEPAAQAIDELGLTSWVADLPDGMQTKLGDGGYVLSAGQEQLVAFARILIRDPHIVILDEATARMDPVTEARVHAATERLLRDRIGIVIAHRLSSVRRCDEVVVLTDGAVEEAGPLRQSRRFARLLQTSDAIIPAQASPGTRVEVPELVGVGAGRTLPEDPADDLEELWAESADPPPNQPPPNQPPGHQTSAEQTPADQKPLAEASLGVPQKADPPPLPETPPARTMREIFRLMTNDSRYGLAAVGIFTIMVVLGLDGAVLPWLWADFVDGTGELIWPAVGIVAALLVIIPIPYFAFTWFPEWWVRQMLRISLRLVHGQTGPRRVSSHTPAEVVAQGGDTERVVVLGDNLVDQFISAVLVIAMTIVSGSFVPALFFAGTMLVSGLVATLFGPRLEKSARRTVGARAAFATALASSLSASRTVKLAGATKPVLAHLARLDQDRSDRQRKEIAVQVWARSTPSMLSGLLPIGAWALFLFGNLSAGATLVAVSTLGAARWFAWTTASLVSAYPSARVWTRRAVAMTGVASYSDAVAGVDISAGTAPAPPTAPRHHLQRLDLKNFTAVHENGALGVRDVDLTVQRGELVLVVGPVGSGKSSMLRALAGIVHHTGELRWNDQPVTEPEIFLRPNQVGYVAQLPRVLSGTVADNIQLGHQVNADRAVATAQLDHDLAVAGAGLGLLIGHKGTQLSGGQLQRLALARALAPETELLIADDVSSALDVTTELELWRALRNHGVTVVGSTSKHAALAQADRVLVLINGAPVAQGTWRELSPRWGHLAG